MQAPDEQKEAVALLRYERTGSDHGLNIAGHAPQIDGQSQKQFALVNVGRQSADEFAILSLGP